jgi:uncharacterized integral membrane protein
MKNKTRFQKQAGLLLLILALISVVNATGVSIPYSRSMPLEIAPGQAKIIPLELQAGNTSGKTITIKSEIIAGNEIASFVDSNPIYEIQEKGVVVSNVKITVPSNAPEGKEYIVTYKFSDVTPTVESGTVVFMGAFEVSMKVIVKTPVVEKQAEIVEIEKETISSSFVFLIVLLILILLVLIIIYLITKKNKSLEKISKKTRK